MGIFSNIYKQIREAHSYIKWELAQDSGSEVMETNASFSQLIEEEARLADRLIETNKQAKGEFRVVSMDGRDESNA